ncbi:anti-sigma factor family protein [Acidihalobacter prosperus]
MIAISCRRAAELLSRSRDEGLEGMNRLALAVHLGLCTNCRTYSRQLRWIEEALNRPPAAGLDEGARLRIARVLEEAPPGGE